MAGFSLATIVFLLACVPLFRRKPSAMRQTARENDANRVIMLVLTIVLSLVILVTVAGELVRPGHPSGIEKLLIITTLTLAWTFANMVYAHHYSHLFDPRDDGGQDMAGLDFPGERPGPRPRGVL